MGETPEAAVHYHVKDEIAVLTIDFPPVNALGAPVRDGLVMRLGQALADPAAKGIVIVGANDKFVAGADIREFGKPSKGAESNTIREMMETSAKPIVVAIDGHALGGGLELALAAPYRVATARAKLGLPEVTLGLLPGGGGTQRGTRVMGPGNALDLILSGKHVSAAKGAALGLIDEVTEDDVLTAAIAFARKKAAKGGPYPRAIERTDKVSDVDPSIFEEVRAENAKKWKGMVAPFKIVDCIEAATKLSPDDGLKFEREAFKVCLESPARAALIHLFFAERNAARINGISPDARPKQIGNAAIVGAGTMGGGIAMALVNAGIPVKLLEVSQGALDAGLAKIKANYETSVSRGSTSQDKVDKALALITPVLSYDSIGAADLVIEAVFEDMTLKKEVLGRLDACMKPGALIATNTSSLDIDEIAGATRRPEDVIGMHFFSPANVMKLLENVRGKKSSDQTIVTAMTFAKRIGKVAVLAGNCHGFIGNRILGAYGREAGFLLEEGATPWQVDNALMEFGFPMGVFLMHDMAGLDVSWRIRQHRAKTRDPSERYSPVADRICELGRFGQKAGAGYYKYDGRSPTPDPKIEALIEGVSKELGIARKPISDEEIVERVLTAMVNEGAFILEEGIAQRASDIDVTYVYGYGFPRYRGGPMFWAERQGLQKVLASVKRYEAIHGKLWRPAPLLERLAMEGKGWPAD